ncbi:aspartyl-phosphate phosphatase Spo0E family protein [Brevibacillus laterosporus]|uniref:aspartyl-phosphate phosphatase Spo0E family protein n=1 Tax=Brevibacillus laterosporus TaxID=1465 RepID=UPI000EAF0201|nr:aspartyl-phosphate phosphatase Spo0E family protein [Brevibacillus laterosporus]AYK08763.1 aspartyl-phosphate phosphatase Spo0E family protein [Brevibacillus laterosporus]MCR8994739.1 aspartyl-phosphate phosphatase Spo0E family protein [Brevibacillus laterosporus]
MENTQSKDELQKLIEILRQELAQLYFKKGSLVHSAVLQISQQLDEYIVMFEKLRHQLVDMNSCTENFTKPNRGNNY